MTAPLRGPGSRLRPATHLVRAAYATLLASTSVSPEAIVRTRWDGDAVTPILLRAASTPASRDVPSWAGVLAGIAVGDFIESLQPLSAGARVIGAAVQVSLDGVNEISLPRRLDPLTPDVVAWVRETGATPVVQLQVAGTKLGPARKLSCIAVVTEETLRSSAAEAVIKTLLAENAALSLDATLFSDLPATAERPAGLMFGVTAQVATPGGGDDALLADLAMLAGAIGTVTTGLAIIAHPKQATAIKLRRGALWPADVPVWPTLGVAPGTVIALDPAALITGFGSVPEFQESKHALLNMNTAPNVDPLVGSPTQSLFQIAAKAIEVRLRAAWAWRVAGAVSWVQGATW